MSWVSADDYRVIIVCTVIRRDILLDYEIIHLYNTENFFYFFLVMQHYQCSIAETLIGR